MHVNIRKYKRATGHKINDAIGNLSSTGNENVIRHFECVILHSLPIACIAGVKRGGGRGGGREFGQKTEDQGGGEGEKERLL